MTDYTTLTDTELAAELKSAYGWHMQLEVSGAAYAITASANQAAAARSRYYALSTEQERREKEVA